MKKFVLLLFVSFLTYNFAFAQSFEKGDILIDAGIGLGIYATEVTTEISGVKSKETDGTASVIIPLKAQYGISNKFSVGIVFQPENYIEDSDSVDINNEDFKGSTFRFIGTYYIINKDKFNLNAELGIGLASLDQSAEDENGDKFRADWRGSSFTIGLGIKYYFTESIGFFANTIYSTYSFNLDEISANGTSFKTDDWEARFSGAQISAGLAVKF